MQGFVRAFHERINHANATPCQVVPPPRAGCCVGYRIRWLTPQTTDFPPQRNPGVEARLAFKKIWGVGAKTAAALYEREGVRSIGELRVCFV